MHNVQPRHSGKRERSRAASAVVVGLMGFVLFAAGCRDASVHPVALPPSDPDVIVVGAGLSGLVTAIELAEGGARVVVVDAASVFGGHAVMSAGDICIVGTDYQRQHDVHDTPEAAFEDIMAVGRTPSAEWARYYAEHSGREIYDWLSALGVEFERLLRDTGHRTARVHRTKGRGMALVGPVYRKALSYPGIEFVWNTRVEGLIAKDGRVTGIEYRNQRLGARGRMAAQVVVLATGGFQSNLDMVREHWAAGAPFPPRFLEGSGINSTGSGHELAESIGADLVQMERQMNLASGIPDPRYPWGRRGLNARIPDSIWVNLTGERFASEGLGAVGGLPVLLKQPQATYWAIFDDQAAPAMAISGTDWGSPARIKELVLDNPALTIKAASLEELAAKTGLPPQTLIATVARYNESVKLGVDRDFGRFGSGITRMPAAITSPPYHAIQFFPLTRKSMGGVAIDQQCRVLDAAGRVIPGLYAVGEMTGSAGINGETGMGGMFLGPCIVTGRVAGRSALGELPPRAPASPAAVMSAEVGVRSFAQDTQACLQCHALPTQVALQREGYWHFEQVHRVVLQRGMDCASCHSEISSTHPSTFHRHDLRQLSLRCMICHQADE